MNEKRDLLDKLHACYLELFLEANETGHDTPRRRHLAAAARRLRRCHKRLFVARFSAATPAYADASERLLLINRRLSEGIERLDDTAAFLAEVSELIESVEALIASAAAALA